MQGSTVAGCEPSQDKGPITQIQIGVACNGARSDAVGKLDPGSRAIHALNPSKACQCETVFQVAFCWLTSAILITICTLSHSETWRRKDVADTVAPHAHLEALTKTQPTDVPEETQADSCPHTLTVASFLGRMRPTILTIEKPSGAPFVLNALTIPECLPVPATQSGRESHHTLLLHAPCPWCHKRGSKHTIPRMTRPFQTAACNLCSECPAT